MWAAEKGHTHFVEGLLKHKVDLNAKDKQGLTALQHAERAWDGLAAKPTIIALIKSYQSEALTLDPSQKMRHKS